MRTVFGPALGISLVVGSLAACGSSTPEAKTDVSPATAQPAHHSGSGISMEAEVGAMNESEVTSTFQRAQAKLVHCYEKGTQRVPFLGGKVRFAVRVDENGKAKTVHLSESTLGDRETERCMIDILKTTSWPSPKGGKEGRAESGFALDPDGDVRLPVSWSESDLGKNAGAVRDAIAKCKSSAGAGAIKATFYVDTNGRAQTVGVSGSEPATEQAAECIVDALKAIHFSAPGSYAAKVSIDG